MATCERMHGSHQTAKRRLPRPAPAQARPARTGPSASPATLTCVILRDLAALAHAWLSNLSGHACMQLLKVHRAVRRTLQILLARIYIGLSMQQYNKHIEVRSA